MSMLNRILSVGLLGMVCAGAAQAQGTLTAKANNPRPTSASENDNDRLRDGLNGPVRRIRTEVVKVSSVDGKVVESGKRVLLESAEYDLKGAKMVNQYFPAAGSAGTGREVYKYDDKGNISEMTLTGTDGALISKEVYKYEYDTLGNWTKMTTSVAVVENGAISFEPTEVTYRTISYYLNAAMTNAMQPSSNTVAPVVKSTSNTPTNNANANVKSAPQQTLVAALQIPRHSPVNFSSQSNQPVIDVRSPLFVTDRKVAVDNAPAPPASHPSAPVSSGVLNGNAINLPSPIYPEAARRMSVAGLVEVEVVIDENGKVLSAKAVSGPVVLRAGAVQAALRARFTPTKLSGQPVKVSGKIVYNFKRTQ